MNRLVTLGALSLVVLVCGSIAVELIRQDAGYILISVGNTTIESSFWLIALPLALLALYWVYRLLLRTLRSFGLGFKVLSNRRNKKLLQKSHTGLLHFVEGDWQAAKKSLLSVARQSEQPVLHYLAAAQSAEALGNLDEAKALVKEACKVGPKGHLGVLLAQARIELLSENYEACLKTIQPVMAAKPSHPVALQLMHRCYEKLGDWNALIEILPRLKASKQYGVDAFSALQARAYCAWLHAESRIGEPSGRAQRIASLWQKIPKPLKTSSLLVVEFSRILLQQKQDDKAEAVLRSAIKKDAQPVLIKLYGQVTSAQSSDQLAHVERWLKDSPNDADLLMAAARIAVRCELWGKAKAYFEKSISLQESPVAYAELAALVAQLGDHEKSTALYQKGLLLTAAS